jgi:hypothetical protein
MTFSPQNFVANVGPTINAVWLNEIDVTCNFVLNGAQTVAQAQAALGIPTGGLPLPITVSQGGTGATTAAGAITNLGALSTSNVTANFLGGVLYPETPAETGAGATPINPQFLPGQLDRYANNTTPGTTSMDAALVASAAQAAQPGGAPILIANAYALTGTHTLASGISMVAMDSGSITIATAQTLTINCALSAPRISLFLGAGTVVLGPGSCQAAFPEWWGAEPNSIGTTFGTDCTAAFLNAIAACSGGSVALGVGIGVVPLSLQSGYYLTGNLIFTPAFTMFGVGRKNSGFIAKSGTTGTWFTDNGNAAGIIFQDFAMYGNSANCTSMQYGLRLGYGTSQHGSEGYLRGLWVRDVYGSSSGFALDLNANVGFYNLISIYGPTSPAAGCSLMRLNGSASYISNCAFVGAGANAYSFYENNAGGSAVNIEIEAPGTCNASFAPLSIQASSFHIGMIVSLATGTTFDHLVELGASAIYGTLGIAYFNNSAVAVGGGNIYNIAKTAYVGGNCGSSSNSPGQGTAFYAWPSGTLISGSATFAGVTAVTVTFPFSQGVTNYRVRLSQSASSVSPPWWTSKTASGFTINFTAAYTGTVDWDIVVD